MQPSLKIATWNINSLRLRVAHLAKIDADIICLQEMKCQNHEVPTNELKKLGFEHHYLRGEKAYNGVGIFSRFPLADMETLDFGGNSQSRHISAKLPDGTRLHNFYVPAGGDEPDVKINPSYAHKLKFVEDMTSYFHSLRGTNPSEAQARATPAKLGAALERNNQNHIILGDFNIAPLEHDVWSSKQLQNVISHTAPERELMDKMYKTLDWVDVSRHFVPHNEKCYSWWSYRNQDWKKSNRGRRLDHIWVTPPLQDKLKSHHIIRDARDWEKPSDHVPVIVGIDF
jgi:exodeoxyribonuclease-3